jgi:hypothetical protein
VRGLQAALRLPGGDVRGLQAVLRLPSEQQREFPPGGGAEALQAAARGIRPAAAREDLYGGENLGCRWR